ncbi:MAG: sugar phosphate isomerase/epimerase [Bacteroidales bacterium]|nr:sugar phosphate isomerase/epimerase [Bacteroidales bacterium]
MKRRNLLTIILLIAITGSMSVSLSSFKPAKKKNIGLQLYSIRDSIRKNVPAAIEKVAKMGYTFVEPAGYSDGKFYGMDPVAFKDLCRKNGMHVLSSHTSQPLPNETNRDKIMAWWDACIDAHVAVGAKYIVQPSMGGDAYKSLETLKKYCDYFNTVGEKCKAKGIRFGYHNHDREFSTQLDGQVMYDFMLQNTDPEKVFFQLDLYWCVVGKKNPVDYFKKYPRRFILWHIKDEKEIGASGMMDFASMWAARKVSGMKYGIVEVERYSYDQFTSCQKSIEFLNAAEYVKMRK